MAAHVANFLLIPYAKKAIKRVRKGTIGVEDIDPDVMLAGRTFILNYDDALVRAEEVAAESDTAYLTSQIARANGARASRPPERYDPSDSRWIPGSGAASREGYDATDRGY